MTEEKTMKEIIVTTQEEMDAIPPGYTGCISIKTNDVITIVRAYPQRVAVKENSHVIAMDNSDIAAMDNSIVEAYERSSVHAWNNSTVIAHDNSYVLAQDSSKVFANGSSTVEAWGSSEITATEHSSVDAFSYNTIHAEEYSSVCVHCSYVSVTAAGKSRIINNVYNTNIILSDGAYVVSRPETIQGFMNFYGIAHDKTTAIFYKVVRKVNGKYISDHCPDFEYVIGEYKSEKCDPDITKSCAPGIHIAPLDKVLKLGKDWDDIAVLEVETNISDIILPKCHDGKVRTSRVKVIREVPLNECGILGKMIADKIGKRNTYMENTDDEAEFTAEKECIEYERKSEDFVTKCFIPYDNELNITSISDAVFIHVLSNSERVCKYLGDHNYTSEGLDKPGIYIWWTNPVVETEEHWYLIDSIVDYLQTKKSNILNKT